MDLRHHIRVLWRWKAILVGGTTLACIVAILASFTLSFSDGVDVKWRSEAAYTSTSRVFVTQQGFPWGRVTLPGTVPGAPVEKDESSRVFAAPDRFSNLAIVYSYLAQSAQVSALMAPQPLGEQIVVTPAYTNSGDALPLLEITTTADHPLKSQALNNAVVKGLGDYLDAENNDAKVAAADRVTLQLLNPPGPGLLTAGRSPTLSAVAFILVMVGTLALVYILENLLPMATGRRDFHALDGDELFGHEELFAPYDDSRASPTGRASAS
jgi:hypothetical protein